ncbi:unnamed protein product, partial [Hapterophycus canaliculatus]
PSLILTSGRNPRVLKIPAYSLGFAGSVYVLRVEFAGGTQSATSATATVEVTHGAIIAHISGGTARRVSNLETLYLNASESIDEDLLDHLTTYFSWNCTDNAGADCMSSDRDILNMEAFTSGGLLTIPAGTLPIGVDYTFGVSVAKVQLDAVNWNEVRKDDSTCVVTTVGAALPHVSISPKVILRKYNPSERTVLHGCASLSPEESCSSSSSSRFELEWGEESGNLDLRDGWGEAFSTTVNARTLVVRKGVLGAGQAYTFSLSAMDSSGLEGYAEFTIETNAPPSGGHLQSDRLSVTAAVDPVLLRSLGWTDDVDDLPLTHSFGYVQGYQEGIPTASGSALVNRLSSSWSVSTTLGLRIPPGLAQDGYNLTIVVSVADNLGSIATTTLGADGAPMVIVSVPPEEQDSVLALAFNLTCLSGLQCGNSSLSFPETTLRDARVATALLRETPVTSSEDQNALPALQADIVGLIAKAYFSLEGSSGNIVSASQALAEALALSPDSGTTLESSLSEASNAVVDMVEMVASHEAALDDAAAVSFVSVVAELLGGQNASPYSTADTALVGKTDRLTLLADLGKALAVESEAQEELGETRGGSLTVQPTRIHSMDMPGQTISVGQNGTRISFSSWDTAINTDEDFDTTRIFSAAVFDLTTSGLEGVAVIDAWGVRGVPESQFAQPIEVFMALPEPYAIEPGTEAKYGGQHHLGCGYWSEDSDAWKTYGMALGSLGVDLDTNAAIMLCTTYHLSAFASREESTTPQWGTDDLFMDVSVFVKYGANSWAALLFLGCVVAALVIPAAWFSWQDAEHGRHREYVETLRSTYLARGKSCRELRPLKQRVTSRAQASRRKLMEDQANERDGFMFHQVVATPKNEKRLAKAGSANVLFNHSWRHLSDSPTAHFSKTLITRSQHMVLLLADWMSAIVLQAIFYGKSQFGVREKVEMTLVSALFMFPTAVMFPALLRVANTPPSSQTLEVAARAQEEEPGGPNNDRYDQLKVVQEERDADFGRILQEARSKGGDRANRGGFAASTDDAGSKASVARYVS